MRDLSAQTRALELVDPPLLVLMERHGIEVVQLFPTPPHRADQMGRLQDGQVLRQRLTGHVDALAQLAERLAVVLVQPVEELPSRAFGQRLEDLVQCGTAL